MKCPVCKEPDLVMTDRQGIEIDYCPQCRGVWLDRGELDKLIERSAVRAPDDRYRSQQNEERDRDYDYSERRHADDDYHDRRHRKKRGGFLGDLFDFD